MKKSFTITGMHCVSCAMSIDGELEDVEGIHEASTNYHTAQTAVRFDKTKISPEGIIEAIKKVGYEAIPVEED